MPLRNPNEPGLPAKDIALIKKYQQPISFNIDAFGPYELWSALCALEFTERAKYFSNQEILLQATSTTAGLLALSGKRNPYPGKLGVIEVGAYADLLVVDGNPMQDISVLSDPQTNLKLIMKDGKIYKNTL